MFQNQHLYLGFYSNDFLANSHLALHTHSLQAVRVAIYNSYDTVLKEQCTFSASIGEMFLKIHVWQFT